MNEPFVKFFMFVLTMSNGCAVKATYSMRQYSANLLKEYFSEVRYNVLVHLSPSSGEPL